MEIFSHIATQSLLFLTIYFEVFLLVTYFEEKEHFALAQVSTRMPGKYPSVTIIIPAWNESETIQGTVQSLLDLEYPKDRLKISIVDDGSTDNTLSIAQMYSENPQISIFSKPNGGKHSALNFGINQSSSDLVGCLDADSFVDKNALKEIIPYFDNALVMAVTPSVQIHKPDNVLRRIQATEYMIGEFTRKIFARLNGLYVTPGPFSIYRRSIFEKIGGFAHGFNTEDMEMAMRMQSNHMKIENAHTAFVYTVSPRTVKELYNQRVRWVTGFLKNAIFSYPHMFFSRKHGNLGLLTLPFAFVSIFIVLFFSTIYVKGILARGHEWYIKYSALGIDFGIPNFDWFAFDFGFQRLLIYTMFFAIVFFILMGIRMAKNRIVISRDLFYFIAFYGFIAPFWLARAVYNLITAKEAKWR